jgi:hypothetical protein
MSTRLFARWLALAIVTSAALTALCELLHAVEAGRMEPALTWLLSTEMLLPVLLATLALAFFRVRKSHHPRRHTP